ncbi:uncharacterized protein LOC126908740 isoform X2 [Daktulosphaira vitifoliae]|uniref:uncharacterized protein LOC126908740 isoform X2 n=1 Tax=Daktulosphaira vitifoliae TaxID=58002 RepID=UPI0021AA048A|nr:uncharacterized protein LOC126908740 isoform X2 [Daktulosphaira vitifoliae]
MTTDDERPARIEAMSRQYVYIESPEIAAAAEFLDTSIYVFTKEDGWSFFSKKGISEADKGEKCKYLMNKEEHFMPVISTKLIDEKEYQPEVIQEKMKNILHKMTNCLSIKSDSSS